MKIDEQQKSLMVAQKTYTRSVLKIALRLNIIPIEPRLFLLNQLNIPFMCYVSRKGHVTEGAAVFFYVKHKPLWNVLMLQGYENIQITYELTIPPEIKHGQGIGKGTGSA